MLSFTDYLSSRRALLNNDLETCVVSLEWTPELLLEMIERRLNLPFSTKLALRGPTWDHFFESSQDFSSRDYIFEYCQHRPRDILTFCESAITIAQSHKHERVRIEDLQAARQAFSESRFKDLCDEYSENFPQLQVLLSRFSGLGIKYTRAGIESIISKLLVDAKIKKHCPWLDEYCQPEAFIKLLYNIGFAGLETQNVVDYRSVGVRGQVAPAAAGTIVVIHPSYRAYLNLQDIVVNQFEDALYQLPTGFVRDVPGAVSAEEEYGENLSALETQLASLPMDEDHAQEFEKIIGEMARLVFFRGLNSFEPHVRDINGRIIRDWVCANVANDGFWEMIRQRYGATQVVWDCKNYEQLQADDFNQLNRYLTQERGRFGVIVFRGEIKKHYFEHLKDVANQGDKFILLLTDRDFLVFSRQARNGRVKENHIQEIYNMTIRKL